MTVGEPAETAPLTAIEPRIVRIAAVDDPRIADYRQVREADLLGRRGAFVAEGAVVLRVLVERGRFATRSVLLAEPRVPSFAPLLARLADDVPIFVAPPALMNEVAGFRIHRGILAVGERGDPLPPAEILDAARPGPRLLVALEALTNHDNVGGVFRNAAAFGIDGVLLDDRCCDPLYRKAIRVSVGGALCVPFARAGSSAELLAALRGAGFVTVALTPRADAVEIGELARALTVARAPRLALLLGTEGPGLSAALLDGADHAARIAMAAGFDSLNVATACGVALHQLCLARRSAPACADASC